MKNIDFTKDNTAYIFSDGFIISSKLSIIDFTLVTLNNNIYSVYYTLNDDKM